MNGEIGNENNEVDEDEVESVDSLEDTIVLSEDADDIDTVGDFTGEINVEKLVAKVESGEVDADVHEKEVHRRLVELEEKKLAEKDLDSTYNFNIDDDL